jgi:hypothetical protein
MRAALLQRKCSENMVVNYRDRYKHSNRNANLAHPLFGGLWGGEVLPDESAQRRIDQAKKGINEAQKRRGFGREKAR